MGVGLVAQIASRLNSFKFFYLPPIDDVQPNQCIGNLALMSEVSMIANDDLQHATRLASLSEFGWHMLNFFLAATYTNPSDDDEKIRSQGAGK